MIVDIETDSVILLWHGSRDKRAIDEFDRFVAFFKKWSGLKKVYPGALELADPPVPAAIERAAAEGAARIWAYPLFLFPGRHMQEDLPRLLSEGQKKYSDLRIYFGDALSRNQKLLELAKIRIDPAKERSDPKGSALLMVASGTSEPKAIAAAEAFTGGLKRLLPYADSILCFADLASPGIPEGFARCAGMGAKGVVVFPSLLFAGTTLQRIEKEVDLMRRRHPDLPIRVTGHFGIDPLLAEIVWEGIKNSRPIHLNPSPS